MNSFYLLKDIDFDNTYNHVVSFSNKAEQHDYFSSKIVGGFDSLCRYVKPNEYTNILVEIDELTLQQYSYCMFNLDLNGITKTIYAFIVDTKANAINRTIVTLEVDTWQTYQFDFSLKECFVSRCHMPRKFENCYEVENLDVGDTLINEKIKKLQKRELLFALIYSTEPLDKTVTQGQHHTNGYCYITPLLHTFIHPLYGMVDGVKKVFHDLQSLKELSVNHTEIKNIFITFNINALIDYDTNFNVTFTHPISNVNNRLVDGRLLFEINSGGLVTQYNIANYDTSNDMKTLDTKCYTYPYFYYTITNNRGNEYIIKPQHITNSTLKIMYILAWDMTIKEGYFVDNYLDKKTNTNMAINISGSEFSLLSDPYIDYMRANKNSERAGLIANSVGGLMGVVGSAISKNPVSMISGLTNTTLSLLQTRAKQQDLQNAPDTIRKAGGNWLFDYISENGGLELNKVYLPNNQMERLHKDFTRYGYTMNNYQKPNIKSRKFFNYIRNIETNIKADLPNKVKERIKSIFNNGVTVWHYTKNNGVDICNYDVDNSEV